MKIKTSELTRTQLDYAVAVANNMGVHVRDKVTCQNEQTTPVFACFTETSELIEWRPTTNWAQGGPIIERECIDIAAYDAASTEPKNPEYWEATIYATYEAVVQWGVAPLIAAMRCYVASKLGDEVEVPDELA